MKATLELSDDATAQQIDLTADSFDDLINLVTAGAQDWVDGGEWGVDGASIQVRWRVTEIDGEPSDLAGSITVDVAPDIGHLIRAATRGYETCGRAEEDHEWTYEGEGGLVENPGVWQYKATGVVECSHCRRCGLHRTRKSIGTERNPGEHDSVEFRMLDDDEIAKHRENGDMDDVGDV